MWEDSYACVPSTHLVIDSNDNHQSHADDQLCHRRFAWITADLRQFPCPCPGIRALSWLERASTDELSPGGEPSCSTRAAEANRRAAGWDATVSGMCAGNAIGSSVGPKAGGVAGVVLAKVVYSGAQALTYKAMGQSNELS
jgi:hypothetical protein